MREGRVKSPSGQAMPNVYRENVQLQDRVAHLLDVVESLRHESVQVQAEMEKLRKERDYHRMHHRRILQDKAGLVGELKREQQRAQQLQSENEVLRNKRAAALRSKMLARIQRDQAQTELQATLRRTQDGADEEDGGLDETGARTWDDVPLRSEDKSVVVCLARDI
jgi:chromosome segregation ATPase